MTWRRATLYVDCHDLCRWLGAQRPGAPAGSVVARLFDESIELLGDVACALSFPSRRRAELDRADGHIARLRVFGRLAAELGEWPPARARHLAGRLDVIGRMVGGWSRSMHAASPPALRSGPDPSGVAP
ncbi:MAG: hypothetical protein IPM29_28400 [Planctomycetes bacterium]|nr:hypothetical protein [Planctomycetota bacterium]